MFIKICTQLFSWKKSPNFGLCTSIIFKKLINENNRPIGENSSNPVTLIMTMTPSFICVKFADILGSLQIFHMIQSYDHELQRQRCRTLQRRR
jgi:hypothetical protein